MNKEQAEQCLILKCYGGSITYGTNHADSDTDIKDIFIPPKEYWIGLQNVRSVEHMSDEFDICYHSLRHFFDLAIKANPNILEMLYLRDNMYLTKDVPKHLRKFGQKLIDNRELFLTKKAKYTYMGYAFSQLHRMDKLNKNANTNPKRVALVEKHGFDTKNAMHLFRLLRTGLEILTTGELHVHRADKKFLLEVKDGKYTYDEVIAEAKRYEGLMEEAVIKSDLPTKPDFNKIENLLIEIVEEVLWNKRITINKI